MKNMTVKKFFGLGAKVIISVVVLLFLGLHSLNFFQFTFPADQWFYAYLGFGLTSGGVILYLVMFMTDTDTELKKFIAIIMLCVSVIGELATAGFGMQIESWKSAGYELAESDFQFMIIGVQLLSLFHALAMIAYFAGDKIAAAFGDEDGDGIPNWRDKKDDRRPQQPQRPQNQPQFQNNAMETKLAELEAENARLKAERPNSQAGKSPD